MVLSAPEVASIWGLASKDSGDFSSLIPQVGPHRSLVVLLCLVGQTHSLFSLAAAQRDLGTCPGC